MWWVQLRRGSYRPKSTVSAANQPQSSMPTTYFCADWDMYTSIAGRGITKRSVVTTKLLNSTLITLSRMPQRQTVLANARVMDGSSTERRKSPKLEGWLDGLCNGVGTTGPYSFWPDMRSPMSSEISMMALPSLTEPCQLILTLRWVGI